MKRFTQKPILLGLATLCILLSGCNQDEIDSLTSERDSLRTQVTTLTSEKQAAETKASSAEGQVSTIQSQLTQAQNELNELKATSTADKAKIATLESEKSDLEEKLNTAQVALDKATTDSDDLKKQLTDLQSQVEKLQDEVQTLKLANYSFEDNATVVLDAGADNLPDGLEDKGDAERGFSFNSTHVYVADKDATKIWYWSLDGSSTEASALKDSEGIIGGGTFKLSDVVATENGIIASNLSINSSFKVYRWKDNNSEPELLINYEDKKGRYGDTFTFEGEPNGDGKLYAGNRSSSNVLSWDFESGEVVNKDSPNEIILTELKLGNYPHVYHIHGDKEYLLVNNAVITPTLYSHDGAQQLASISSEVVISGVISGKIFDFNAKTYLAVATAGSIGSIDRDAAILVYDVSGDDLVEAFKNLSSDKLVYQKAFGQNVNGNQAADVDVYVDPNGEFVHLLGGAANNGFIVVKVTK